MSNQLEKVKELIELRSTGPVWVEVRKPSKNNTIKVSTQPSERISMLLDEGSFEEMDMFVQHRCTNFGMDKKALFGRRRRNRITEQSKAAG